MFVGVIIYVGDLFVLMVEVLVIDKEDGDFIFKIKVDGEVDIIKVGIYVLMYMVIDFKGYEVMVK